MTARLSRKEFLAFSALAASACRRGPFHIAGHMPRRSGVVRTLPSEKRVYRDAKTGREVWQMTQGPSVDHGCYQEVESFTEDERYVLFSSTRTGEFQLYRAELATGEIAQLSNVPGYWHNSFAMAVNGREALYVAGWRLYAVDVHTGETRVAFDFQGKLPKAPRGSPIAQSKNGDRCVIGWSPEENVTCLGFALFDSGDLHEILRWPGRLSHPQICPADPDLVTFDPLPDTQNDMSLPMYKRARSWILDARIGEARPFLITPYGFRATHEYWDHEGARLYFHKKSVPDWTPTTISSFNRDGNDWRDHYQSLNRKLGHSSIDRRGTFIISDVQTDGPNELYRVDLGTGTAEILCWVDTSNISDQTVHAHPSISAQGNYTEFTSDRAGSSDLYVVPLGRA